MKQVLLAAAACAAVSMSIAAPAQAQGYYGHEHRWHHGYGFHNQENPYHREARMMHSEMRREIVARQEAHRRHFVHWERAHRGY